MKEEPARLINVFKRMTKVKMYNLRARSSEHGFSLAELLIVVVIGGVLMTGAATMIISHMRSSARSEAIMRLQESWSRVQFLLDQEIQEASGSPSSTTCSSLTLTVPNPDVSGSNLTITYSLVGTELRRTGPPVNSDGTLNGKLDNDGRTPSSTEIVMTRVSSFCPTSSGGDVDYTLGLTDVTGVTYQNQSEVSGARTRSRIID